MATVVWLGSPDGPEEIEWMGKTFAKDKPVQIEDETVLAKATGNRFFKVEGFTASTKHAEPVTYRSAVEQSAQGPVPKPGEPIVREEFQQAKVESEGHHPAAVHKPSRKS